ncbi:hypothetical protein BpHYR1_032700 [Brachionus plicatilis]|uniref:Uncharacterized protein n=1 Tax=Brachionus plicatilis TaxID=10195 RepID=A0A3M7Q4S1_BRAPC|nr:hypothetical protein BpHYR1_032700 [Brachionus plicatilis]
MEYENTEETPKTNKTFRAIKTTIAKELYKLMIQLMFHVRLLSSRKIFNLLNRLKRSTNNFKFLFVNY